MQQMHKEVKMIVTSYCTYIVEQKKSRISSCAGNLESNHAKMMSKPMIFFLLCGIQLNNDQFALLVSTRVSSDTLPQQIYILWITQIQLAGRFFTYPHFTVAVIPTYHSRLILLQNLPEYHYHSFSRE